ncbi:MAG TPA: oxygenase MpaB family protein [Acidimicrobiales bacterium]|jgi:hypothetical protein
MTIPDWSDDFLDSLRGHGDPPADAVVSELFRGTGDATSAFRTLVVQQHEVADSDLASFLDGDVDRPDWLDPDRVAAGQECFAGWGSHVFTALYAAALPSAYACWRGVQVLGLTARLETDAKRRLNETAQFHLDIMEPGGLEHGKSGFSDVRHVRLMHAAVRWLVENDPRVHWDPEWGTPINQEDLLETLLTFTEIVFEVFDRTGVKYSQKEADDYLHTWSYVGYLLGIRPDLLPLTRAQTSVLMPIVRRRQFGASDPGHALTTALLAQGSRLSPPGLRGLPAATVRYYVGDHTADLIGVPPADWTRYLFAPMADLSRTLSVGWLHQRFLRALSDRVGFGMLSLAVKGERFGGRPAFAVPTGLAARWDLPPSVPRQPPSNDAIAAMTDPVLRNLWITQRYHELAIELRDSGAGQDATWCAFAVWASKTAGATIRKELLPAKAQRLLFDNEITRAALHTLREGVAGHAWTLLFSHEPLGRAVEKVTADVSTAIAAGNVLVFAELAPLFGTLIAARRGPGVSSPDDLLTALTPALSALERSGVDTTPVRGAFNAYAQALTSAKDRAALILAANTLAVSHEQQRLQSAIQSALNAPISDTLREVVEQDLLSHLPSAEVRGVLDHLTDDVCTALDQAWDVALTEAIMQLVTAAETFDLRRDVPPIDGVLFPPALRDLVGTPAEEVVASWDRTRGTGQPSGADDWCDLGDRMNYIVNLFRSRQRDTALFDPPFTVEQLAAMAQGQVPAPPL